MPPKQTPEKTADVAQVTLQLDTLVAAAVKSLVDTTAAQIAGMVATVQQAALAEPGAAAKLAEQFTATATALIADLVAAAKDQITVTADMAEQWGYVGSLELADLDTAGLSNHGTPKLTAADVVKHVKRRTVLADKGASRTVFSALRPEELLSWHDHGTHIVAVTVDGQKFSSADQV